MTYMSNDGKRGHRLTGVAPSRRHGAHANTQHGCGLARRPEGSRVMDKDPRVGKCEPNAPVTRDDFVQALARLGMSICEKVAGGAASYDEMRLLVELAETTLDLL